jgi:hypothetical protein
VKVTAEYTELSKERDCGSPQSPHREPFAPYSQHKHRGESQCKEYKANHGRFSFWSNRPRRHRNPQTRTEPPEKAASNVLDVVTAVSNLNAQDRRPSNECSAITELSQKKV